MGRTIQTQDATQGVAEASGYQPFTPKLAFQIVAPHTWPAAIVPALLATCIAAVQVAAINPVMVCVLLAICILMQSAVNTFNDYYDFVKGADSSDDDVDPTDAVLIYNKVNPASALKLAVGLLVAAFALGVYVIVCAGLVPLVLGIIGAVIVVAYSAGKTPISYLPIGELTSGFVMGGLIMLACYQALTGVLDVLVLLYSVPAIIGIGLIMMTNNTCDIEKDIEVDRKTLPVLLGREKALRLYHALVGLWVLAILALTAAFFTGGLIVVPFGLLAAYPLLRALLSNPLKANTRMAGMTQICSVNIALGFFYACSILASKAVGLA